MIFTLENFYVYIQFQAEMFNNGLGHISVLWWCFNVYTKMFTPNLIARFYNAEKKIHK